MLENLSETSISDTFYDKQEAEESVEDQPEAESDDSEVEEDPEELADDDTEDDEEDEQDEDAVTLSQVEFKELQDQQLMHADYTKKTQEVASDKKNTVALNSDLSSAISELEALIVNEESDEELKELKEDDYVEYLRRKDAIDSKKATLKGAKSRQDDVLKQTQADESVKLINVMTEWADPKKGVETQKKDVDSALKYAAEIGFINADFEKLSDHKVMRALIDAGKYRKLKESKPAAAKRKTSASKKVTGKKVAGKGKKLTPAELFYGVK